MVDSPAPLFLSCLRGSERGGALTGPTRDFLSCLRGSERQRLRWPDV